MSASPDRARRLLHEFGERVRRSAPVRSADAKERLASIAGVHVPEHEPGERTEKCMECGKDWPCWTYQCATGESSE